MFFNKYRNYLKNYFKKMYNVTIIYSQHRLWLDKSQVVCIYSLNVRYESGRWGVSCSVLPIRNRSVMHDFLYIHTFALSIHAVVRLHMVAYCARPLLALHSANFCLSPFLANVFRSRLPFKRAFLRTELVGASACNLSFSTRP